MLIAKMMRSILIASILSPGTAKRSVNGVFVQEVMGDTPASGKLKEGDVITAMNGKPIHDVTQLRNQIAATPPNTDVKFSVFRDKKQQEVTVKLGDQPEDLRVSSKNGKNGQTSATPNPAPVRHVAATQPDEDPFLERKIKVIRGGAESDVTFKIPVKNDKVLQGASTDGEQIKN